MAAPSNDPNRNSLQDEASRLADTARNRAAGAFEEVKLASNQLVDRIREYIEDANVKHVAIKKDGRTLLEIPMTVGVGAGAAALLFNPVLSAVGALAALVSDVTVVVERDEAPGGTSEAASDPTAGPTGERVENVNAPDANAASDDDSKTVGRS
jgi:hypothetical protein